MYLFMFRFFVSLVPSLGTRCQEGVPWGAFMLPLTVSVVLGANVRRLLMRRIRLPTPYSLSWGNNVLLTTPRVRALPKLGLVA